MRLKTLPALTLSGQTSYFLGILTVGLWVKLEQRALLVLGCLLLIPPLYARVAAWFTMRDLNVVIRRPTSARAWAGGGRLSDGVRLVIRIAANARNGQGRGNRGYGKQEKV